jgi:endonuclease/exonuclease/phosphatase family metal-dependent hydrolase
MPCLDQGIDYIKEILIELEKLVCESEEYGPIIIAGDLNAHLGSLGGPKGTGDANQQGFLIKELINRCSLHTTSMSSLATGPNWNAKTKTTVDYILGDYEASFLVTKCSTHELSMLNNSDHLPISVTMVPPISTSVKPSTLTRVNWHKAINSGTLEIYQDKAAILVRPLLVSSY